MLWDMCDRWHKSRNSLLALLKTNRIVHKTSNLHIRQPNFSNLWAKTMFGKSDAGAFFFHTRQAFIYIHAMVVNELVNEFVSGSKLWILFQKLRVCVFGNVESWPQKAMRAGQFGAWRRISEIATKMRVNLVFCGKRFLTTSAKQSEWFAMRAN
jgi:hypothetical protein